MLNKIKLNLFMFY